tara:strand:- start:1416 stop:1520 length:105 start_codon:yes stop_codon:yes gene_type:complete
LVFEALIAAYAKKLEPFNKNDTNRNKAGIKFSYF